MSSTNNVLYKGERRDYPSSVARGPTVCVAGGLYVPRMYMIIIRFKGVVVKGDVENSKAYEVVDELGDDLSEARTGPECLDDVPHYSE